MPAPRGPAGTILGGTAAPLGLKPSATVDGVLDPGRLDLFLDHAAVGGLTELTHVTGAACRPRSVLSVLAGLLRLLLRPLAEPSGMWESCRRAGAAWQVPRVQLALARRPWQPGLSFSLRGATRSWAIWGKVSERMTRAGGFWAEPPRSEQGVAGP